MVHSYRKNLEVVRRKQKVGNPCFKSSDLVGTLTYEMHHFADASKLAYGAVSYLRITDSESRLHCVFLMEKGHLAPALTTTMPLLELLAAVTAVRLDYILKKGTTNNCIKNSFFGLTRQLSCIAFITAGNAFQYSSLIVWPKLKDTATSLTGDTYHKS